mgnify:CR=1 FL=1
MTAVGQGPAGPVPGWYADPEAHVFNNEYWIFPTYSAPYDEQRFMDVSDRVGSWIEAAQAQGLINPELPAIAVLYTLYARACDPVLEFLKMGELQTDVEIIELVLSTCFEGLNAR